MTDTESAATATTDAATAERPTSIQGIRNMMLRTTESVSKQAPQMRGNIDRNGFNPNVLLLFVGKLFDKDKFDSMYVVVSNYTREDYNAWALPESICRWNVDLDCMEIAVKRHLAKGVKLDKGESPYPADVEYAPVPPGSKLRLQDWSKKTGRAHECHFARALNLYPRSYPLTYIEKYCMAATGQQFNNERRYEWRVGTFNFGMPATAVPVPFVQKMLIEQMPASAFFLRDPRVTGTPDFVLLHVDDICDDQVMQRIESQACSTTHFQFSSDQEGWGCDSDKVANKDTGLENGDGRAVTRKCMRLNGITLQKTAGGKDAPVQVVASSVAVWNDEIEAAFGVHDLHKWYKVARFSFAMLAPMVLVCNVNRKNTGNNLWNGEDAAGEEHATGTLIDMMQPEDEPMTDAEALEKADWGDALEKENERKSAATAATAGSEKVAFYLSLNAVRIVFDPIAVYRNFMVPVTPAWVMTTRASQPYRAPSTGSYPVINFKKMDEQPAVICVSEHVDKANVEKFSGLVSSKQGEYRVAVNSSTFYNRDNMVAFIAALRALSPEDGARLLDGKPIPGSSIVWTRPDTLDCLLFFLNYAARKVDQPILSDLAQIERFVNGGGDAEDAAPPEPVPVPPLSGSHASKGKHAAAVVDQDQDQDVKPAASKKHKHRSTK